MSTPRRVGLLGGTFDPPHVGHLVVAEMARVELDLDEVRLLVAGDPWMKSGAGDAEERVEMAALAVADHPDITVDDRETRRSGPTYTADTLAELTVEEPDTSWVFLIGADAAAKIPQWNRAAEALAGARFVAVARPGYELVLEDPLLAGIERLDTPLIDVSSTDLRARFRDGRAVRYLLPRSVERYIRDGGLYGSTR